MRYLNAHSLGIIGAIVAPLVLLVFFKKGEIELDFDRKYSSNKMRLVSSFTIDFEASDLEYFNGRLFAYSQEAGQILEIDTIGNIITSYGNPGNGPGEIVKVSGMNIDETTVRTIDMRNKTFTQFIRSGSKQESNLYNYVQLDKSFGKGIYLKDNVFLITTRDSNYQDLIFEIYQEGKFKKKMKSVYHHYKDWGFATDGFFVKGQNENNFHICYHISKFFIFDNSGEVRLLGNRIENYEEAPPTVNDGQMIHLAPIAKTLGYTGCADEKSLYIVSAAKASNERSELFDEYSPIDIYNINDGKYVNSFFIPNYKNYKIRTIAKSPNGFYVVQGDNIAYYEKGK